VTTAPVGNLPVSTYRQRAINQLARERDDHDAPDATLQVSTFGFDPARRAKFNE